MFVAPTAAAPEVAGGSVADGSAADGSRYAVSKHHPYSLMIWDRVDSSGTHFVPIDLAAVTTSFLFNGTRKKISLLLTCWEHQILVGKHTENRCSIQSKTTVTLSEIPFR